VWLPEAAELRACPGKWALLCTKPVKPGHQMALAIRKGGLKAFRPAGTFDAVCRKGKVYVRYLGEQEIQP
jgi:hypothetical protein